MSSGSSPSETGGGSDMSDGIMSVVRPAIQQLDAQVQSTRNSQVILAARIRELSDLLHDMSQDQPYDLDVYSRKIDDTKRITNTGKILDNVHDRLSRLQRDIARETYNKKLQITVPLPASPLR